MFAKKIHDLNVNSMQIASCIMVLNIIYWDYFVDIGGNWELCHVHQFSITNLLDDFSRVRAVHLLFVFLFHNRL